MLENAWGWLGNIWGCLEMAWGWLGIDGEIHEMFVDGLEMLGDAWIMFDDVRKSFEVAGADWEILGDAWRWL